MVDAPETEDPARAATDTRFTDALRDSALSAAEIAQYAGHLLATRIDQFKLSIRTLILYAVLGVLGLVAAVSVLAACVVLLFVGAAHGVGTALGGREWLGDLLVSVVVLGAIALGLKVGLGRFKMASRRGTVRKYENRRKQQRERFGHDVAERAGN
jgi:uncharacterized membrane protein